PPGHHRLAPPPPIDQPRPSRRRSHARHPAARRRLSRALDRARRARPHGRGRLRLRLPPISPIHRVILMQSKLLILALALTTPLPAYAQDAFDLQAALAEGPPMTADRAASTALASSPSIERARALSRMSEAAVSRARAAMLPRLELSARYAHVDGFPDGEIAIGGDPDALAAARMLADRVSDPAARTLWLGTLEQQS